MKRPDQKQCRRCSLCETRTQVVVADGGIRRCDYVAIGEGPGKEEDKIGKPFIGRSGQLLRKTMAQHTGYVLGRDIVVLNAVSCRPPDNRTPSIYELETCLDWLRLNIAIIQPKLIMTIGRTSSDLFLKSYYANGMFYNKAYLESCWQRDYYHFDVMPIWHPSYILRHGCDSLYMIPWIEHMQRFGRKN